MQRAKFSEAEQGFLRATQPFVPVQQQDPLFRQTHAVFSARPQNTSYEPTNLREQIEQREGASHALRTHRTSQPIYVSGSSSVRVHRTRLPTIAGDQFRIDESYQAWDAIACTSCWLDKRAARNFGREARVLLGGARWCKVVQGGARWCKVVQGSARWGKVVQGGAMSPTVVAEQKSRKCATQQLSPSRLPKRRNSHGVAPASGSTFTTACHGHKLNEISGIGLTLSCKMLTLS
jgi:hypothetical protein